MKNIPLLLGTLVGTLVLVIGIAVFFSSGSKPKQIDQAQLLQGARHIRGPESAKVTIVEFSDFQCPGCRAAEPIVQDILKRHPNDVRLVYRNFPLTQIHKNGQQAAQAAEAAGASDKFWEMHDQLFATQLDWEGLDNKAFLAKLDEYAAKLQIDKEQFQKKMDAQDVKDGIAADVRLATNLNVNETPTFYVNGQKTAAPQLVTTVESLITP